MKKTLVALFFLLTANWSTLKAQSTEVFETETVGSASFTDNSQVFNITSQAQGPFDMYDCAGCGWNGTAADNRFIDNSGGATANTNPQFTISSSGSTPFILNSFYLFVSDQALTLGVSGSVTITGKLGGATVYTATQSSGFVNSYGTNNGFTFINLATFGGSNNSNKAIDQLVIAAVDNFNYLALDAWNWSTAAPEVNLKGNSTSIADGDATPTTTDHSDFSSQSVCSGTVVRTFTIENTGNAPLGVSAVNITGTHAADFSVTSSPATSVAAAGTTTFQVTFNPSASGTRSATISITNTDANEGTYDFAIQGTGIDPEVNLQGNSTSISDGDATPSATDHTDFGSQAVCSGTIVRTFTIQNTGTSTLTVGTPSLSGTHSTDFSISANPSATVAASGSTTFQVTFNPTASGTRSATVTFTTDDCDESTYDFAIQGTGNDPEVNLQGNGNSINDGDATPSSTDHTDFGSQTVCSGTIVRTFTIQNTGNSTLTVGTPSISGTNAADFSISANPSATVAGAGSTTFQVTFNPSATGTRSATINFSNDDCDEANYNFDIQGTGIEPEVNLQGNGNSITDGDATPSSTDHTDFGSQSVCSGTIVRTFTIQNTGNATLTVGTPSISGTNAADFSVTANPSATVAGSGSTTFQVTFNPSATGTRSATVTFTNDDCDESTYDFAIQGTGTDPEVNLQGNGNSIADGDATPSATDHTDFGSQSVCSGTIVRTFTIQNTGNATLTVGTPSISGTNAADFSVTANPSATVAGSGSTTFQVTFNPSATGTRSATVTFTTDDCDESTYDFAIEGTGVDPEVNLTGNGNGIADGDATPSATNDTDFGSQDFCSGTVVRTFTIENTGNATLNLGTPSVSGTNAADFSITANPSSTVAASGSTTFDVTFNPSAAGTRSATITFTTDDCDEATYNFDIQGTGTDGTPTADAPSNVTACSSYNLPALTVGNYFSGTGGTGTAYSVGNSITGSMTMYVYATNGSCTDENSFSITIGTPITADTPPSDVRECASYMLPALSADNNYYTGTGGTGTLLIAGNSVNSTQTIYIYASKDGCTDENSFVANVFDCIQLDVASCNTTLSNLTDAVYAETVPGATDYRFKIEHAATSYTAGTSTGSSSNFIRLSWLTANPVKYGTTYTISTSAKVGGLWMPFENTCTVTTPATRIQDSYSNSTLVGLSNAVYSYEVAGATDYRYEIRKASDNSFVTISVRGTNDNLFRFSWISGGLIQYNTGYKIRVSAYVGGSWQAFGPSVTVNTPSASKLASGSCGVTLTALTDALYSEVVSGATDYRYEIRKTSDNSLVAISTRGSSDNLFRMSWLTGGVIQANTSYNVRVAAYIGGSWSTYGTICTVTSPSVLGMSTQEDVFSASQAIGADQFALEVYPNPNEGTFHIQANSQDVLEIRNELGQLIQTIQLDQSTGNQAVISGLIPGIYFVRSNNHEMTKKVVVQ